MRFVPGAVAADALAPAAAAIDAATADPRMRAIVVSVGGAPPDAPGDTGGESAIAAFADRCAAARVPVVAALDADVTGGALEIALACAYRIATPGVRIALPGVRRGSAPGTRGSRRTPRLAAALQRVADGAIVNAADALAAGLIDRVAATALPDAARAFASELAAARWWLARAERAAATPPGGVPVPPAALERCAIVGAGTMGAGIATACANAGLAVTLVDVDAALVARALTGIAETYARSVAHGRLSSGERDARLARIRTATDLRAIAGADLVIEAVYEDLDVKREVFARLDALAGPDAILATNTSTLDVDAIAAATQRPGAVLGLHFFSPANVMRLLEIVRGRRTSDTTLARAMGIGVRLGKQCVVAGNGDGFIGNRMLYAYRREAEWLLEDGVAPQRVDAVLQAFGFAMGPFAAADLAGLDIGWRVRKRRRASGVALPPASTIADDLCEAGRFGQKTGAGYYRYAPGDRTPLHDPAVDAIIARAAAASGRRPRAVSDEEIVERCVLPLVNEAARILADGIAARPGDIDVVYCHGYGFPAWRGGPLWWADRRGLAGVVADLDRWYERFGGAWEPAPALRALAARGATFAAWPSEDAPGPQRCGDGELGGGTA